MEYKYCRIERNRAALRPGGGFYGYSGATLSLSYTQVVANTGIKGGGIFLESSCLAFLDHVHFESNEAVVVGGGLSVILASVVMISVTFVDNKAASLGAQVYLDRPTSVKIIDTEFLPFVDGGMSVFFGGRLAGCTEHPCQPGFSCSYEMYSLACTPCPETQISSDGLQCSFCGPGKQPNENSTSCVPCSGMNEYSAHGVCHACDGMAARDPNSRLFTMCLECPSFMVSHPELGCLCEPGASQFLSIGLFSSLGLAF